MTAKQYFNNQLKGFVEELQEHITTKDGQWTVKDFIDVYRNVYTISSDTKIVSKVLEIHLFPRILEFARALGYRVVLADHQNYYPDISFVKANDENTKFAVDFKTTYRNANKDWLCNGFTLGSHGRYFEDRGSTKNIQFPYSWLFVEECELPYTIPIRRTVLLESAQSRWKSKNTIASC